MSKLVEQTAPASALLPQYRVLLESVETLPLAVTGSSMLPFLAPGRDSVVLTRLKNPPKRGDIVLYQRENGVYVLHRVYIVEAGGSCCMVGDAQQELEHGIRPEQMIAVVCAARRKGKVQRPGVFWWEFFSKIWIRLVPLRLFLLRVYQIGRRSA